MKADGGRSKRRVLMEEEKISRGGPKEQTAHRPNTEQAEESEKNADEEEEDEKKVMGSEMRPPLVALALLLFLPFLSLSQARVTG